jgi:hypothetical protein
MAAIRSEAHDIDHLDTNCSRSSHRLVVMSYPRPRDYADLRRREPEPRQKRLKQHMMSFFVFLQRVIVPCSRAWVHGAQADHEDDMQGRLALRSPPADAGISSRQIAGYLAKYLTKCSAKSVRAGPPGCSY